jgi:hypothetical protein
VCGLRRKFLCLLKILSTVSACTKRVREYEKMIALAGDGFDKRRVASDEECDVVLLVDPTNVRFHSI